jgi:hypothetical protein
VYGVFIASTGRPCGIEWHGDRSLGACFAADAYHSGAECHWTPTGNRILPQGTYDIPELPVGIYTVTFSHEGFKTISFENVVQAVESITLSLLGSFLKLHMSSQGGHYDRPTVSIVAGVVNVLHSGSDVNSPPNVRRVIRLENILSPII